jgi:hypothetical protein
VNEHPTRNQAALPRDGGWLPAPAVAKLRELTARYLDGHRALDGQIVDVAKAFAAATHDAELPPERLLIALRALWRDFGFSQSDRLQLASIYDRIVREAIDSYYAH